MAKLSDVLTISETAEKLGISESTMRMRIKRKLIDKKYYRKAKGTYLFDKKYINLELKKTS